MAEIPDHSVQPQIRVRYHSTGEVEVSITLSPQISVAPDNKQTDILVKERKRQYSATRHDSGFSEGSVNENRATLANEADEKDSDSSAFLAKTGNALSEHHKSKSLKMGNNNRKILSELSEEPELETFSSSQEIELNDRLHLSKESERSSSVFQRHAKLILTLVLFIILSSIISVLVWSQIKSKVNHDPENSPKSVISSVIPDYLSTNLNCSSDCNYQAKNISVINGELVCDNDTLRVQCWAGFQTATHQHIYCSESELTVIANIECSAKPCKDSEDITCSDNLMILAGGEVEGIMVDTVETFPPSNLSSCLPHLPRAVKWGALGLLEETGLVLCGGQNLAE